ncbi:MAG: hypothetical protein ACO1OY_09710 [Ramlibacter sp.]
MNVQVTDARRRAEERFKTVAQVMAILLLAGMVGMVLHKGWTDVSALAREHRGEGFWLELVRYLFRNLAG